MPVWLFLVCRWVWCLFYGGFRSWSVFIVFMFAVFAAFWSLLSSVSKVVSCFWAAVR